jgi:hypothetical protein
LCRCGWGSANGLGRPRELEEQANFLPAALRPLCNLCLAESLRRQPAHLFVPGEADCASRPASYDLALRRSDCRQCGGRNARTPSIIGAGAGLRIGHLAELCAAFPAGQASQRGLYLANPPIRLRQ